MDDLISRQAAIEIIQNMYPGMPRVPWLLKDWQKRYEPYIRTENAIRELPSAQPTLYGYNVEHLELIARVLQKENLPPERVVEALTDIASIVAIVRDEFEETLRKAVKECVI